ncbi:WcbI family polysaccharide biosynthesis putative acetyltransferase [Dankookia sp. GCM10030260]|uniref:WcbI family polysaccharide biosynthesis putative acetyltransferase n=1 Tax=Dankookia sp. GCM10030260 TaxID=3273390 RepID=UPI0036063713
MRIAVVGCCQAHGYAHALAHLLPEAEVEAVEAVISRNHDKLDRAAALLRGCDVLFTQDFGAEFGPLATAALPALGPPVHRLPLLAFAGYHPDMVYLTLAGQVQGSPLGAYHSAIIAAAYSLGVAEADVPQLFNRLVYARLGYLQGFAAARTLFLEFLAGYGLDLTAEFEAWHAEGPFMHGINHPRGPVLADVMRAAAIRAGLLGAAAPRVRPPFDHLAADTIWPVYPEIAEPLGLPGGMLFKRYSDPVGPLGNALYIGLPRLLRESYAMYRALPAAAFTEGAAGQVRTKLAVLLG